MSRFVWDELKRLKNLRKHGLDFKYAHLVFDDDYAFSAPDLRFSDDRWLLIGKLENRLVVIAYIQPEADIYRIISMRKAENQEVNRYELEKLRELPSSDDPLVKIIDKLKQNGHSKKTN